MAKTSLSHWSHGLVSLLGQSRLVHLHHPQQATTLVYSRHNLHTHRTRSTCQKNNLQTDESIVPHTVCKCLSSLRHRSHFYQVVEQNHTGHFRYPYDINEITITHIRFTRFWSPTHYQENYPCTTGIDWQIVIKTNSSCPKWCHMIYFCFSHWLWHHFRFLWRSFWFPRLEPRPPAQPLQHCWPEPKIQLSHCSRVVTWTKYCTLIG